MKTSYLILIFLKELGKGYYSKLELNSKLFFLSLYLHSNISFKDYHYGPYSLDIEDNFSKLEGAGFINSFPCNKLNNIKIKNKKLNDTYAFNLSKNSELLIKNIIVKNYANDVKKIKEYINISKELDDFIIFSTATIYSILMKKYGTKPDKKTFIDSLKKSEWKLQESNIDVAYQYLNKMELMK